MSKVLQPVIDILGNTLYPGDIVAYCPGSKRRANLRIGVFVSTGLNSAKNQKVRVRLVEKDNTGVTASIDLECFQERAVLVSMPQFHIDSKLVQQAIRALDDLKDDGLIVPENQSQE